MRKEKERIVERERKRVRERERKRKRERGEEKEREREREVGMTCRDTLTGFLAQLPRDKKRKIEKQFKTKRCKSCDT